MVRVDPQEFSNLPLEVHSILRDVSLRDVSAIDLPGGGAGRTIADVQFLIAEAGVMNANAAVRALFELRRILGAIFRWDSAPPGKQPAGSYIDRLPDELRARSDVAPGTPDGMFRVLYRLDREVLVEIQNATVHAFLCSVLQPRGQDYRLLWAVYVKPTSWLTPVYMTAIEPFRRFIVYPSILARIRKAWIAAYGSV